MTCFQPQLCPTHSQKDHLWGGRRGLTEGAYWSAFRGPVRKVKGRGTELLVGQAEISTLGNKCFFPRCPGPCPVSMPGHGGWSPECMCVCVPMCVCTACLCTCACIPLSASPNTPGRDIVPTPQMGRLGSVRFLDLPEVIYSFTKYFLGWELRCLQAHPQTQVAASRGPGDLASSFPPATHLV